MSSYQDYYDLSSEDNDSDGQGSSSSDDGDDPRVRNRNRNRNRNNDADDNDDNNDCDDDDDDDDTRDALWGRSVVHVDVDCFYVQCEELDRGLRDDPRSDDRPLAIGQKHIVVTCNYAARARGVTKLQSKTEAIRRCPDLRIVDGSDLRSYRNHSRTVYRAFREAVRETIGSAVSLPEASGDLPCRRNAMDEMVADLSAAVDRLVRIEEEGAGAAEGLLSGLGGFGGCRTKTRTRVLGDDAFSASARIVEDQSGASAEVVFGSIFGGGGDVRPRRDRSLAQSRRNVHEAGVVSSPLPGHRTHQCGKLLRQHQHQHQRQQHACRKRLELAARLTRWICEEIFARTGFHVSAGVSVSPMLAKLSVVEKPRTVNLLLPWRSPELLYSMPLRKLPEVGSRTYRALAAAIAPATAAGVGVGTNKTEQGSVVVSVRDLLQAPRDTIVRALRALPSQQQQQQHHGSGSGGGSAACERHCDLILQRCRGLDASTVQDDGGGASKTVSVENSFRRGTVTTESCAAKALDELCARLPPLVRDRAEWSETPSRAYPTTLRLTVRNAVAKPALPRKQSQSQSQSHSQSHSQSQSQSQRPRRRHVTRSKQTSLGGPRGRLLLPPGKPSASASSSREDDKAARMLREAARPLLREFLAGRDSLARIDVTRMNLAVTNFGDAAPMPMPMPATTMMGGDFLSWPPHLAPAATTRHCNKQLPSESGIHPAETADRNKRSITGRIGLDVPGTHASNNSGSGASIPNTNTNRKRTHAPYSRTTRATPAPSRRMDDSSSAVRSNTPRKFSRTRIDQFFAKKP